MKLNILLVGVALGQTKPGWECKDLLPDNGCANLDPNICNNFYHANYQCPQTCGKCDTGILEPVTSLGVCKRDSPCNEQGTAGGNDGGCSSTELYPFFKCKCRPFWDGYRCQWFNCPCRNGGKCRPCLKPNCLDGNQRKCSCPPGWKGRLCEIPKKNWSKPTSTTISAPKPTRPPSTPKPTKPTKAPKPPKTPKPSKTPRPTITLPTSSPPDFNFGKTKFGKWSSWTQCNDQQERYRQRYCTDGYSIRHPKCCYGLIKACKKYDKYPADSEARKPELAVETCQISAFWGEWSGWSRTCNKKNQGLKTVRTRRCTGGRSPTSYGCNGGPPFRRQIKRCPKWGATTISAPKETLLNY